MLLTYSTIFLASLIVALVAYFIYELVSNSSRLLYNSRERNAIISHTRNHQKNKVLRKGTPILSGRKSHVTSQNLARTSPAMPTGNRNENNVWPYRQKKIVSVGNTYKVNRKLTASTPDTPTSVKPWGW